MLRLEPHHELPRSAFAVQPAVLPSGGRMGGRRPAGLEHLVRLPTNAGIHLPVVIMVLAWP